MARRGKRSARPTLQPLPSLQPETPPEIRLRSHSAMRGSWSDPSDSRPNAARTARQINGYRHFDPLRWCRNRHGDRSSISVEHIYAADMLRRYADAIAIGLSGGKNRFNLEYIERLATPKPGPTQAEIRQARAWRPFQRAMALFSQSERRLITSVVLLNRSVLRYCEQLFQETGRKPSAHQEQQRLVACLDRLVEHWRGEIDDDLQHGRIAA